MTCGVNISPKLSIYFNSIKLQNIHFTQSRCSRNDILHLNVWARCIFEPDSGKICKTPPDKTFLFSRPPILLIPAPSGGSSLSPGLLSARLDHLVSHMEGTARISSLAASPLKHFFVSLLEYQLLSEAERDLQTKSPVFQFSPCLIRPVTNL